MNKLGRNRVEAIALTFIAAFALCLLFFPPMVGIADNGDFYRLMYWGKFEYPPLDYRDQYFAWINREYLVSKHPLLFWYGFPSSEALFIKASAIVNLLRSQDRFDIRVLGVVHIIAFAAACSLMLKGWRRAIGGSLLIPILGLVVIFCDIGYLAYFHSFYGESASLIFLLATVGAGMVVVASPTVGFLVLFHAIAFCFVIAKPQNLPLVAPLVLFGIWLHLLRDERRWRWTNLASLIVTVASVVAIFLVIPSRMKEANLYNSVFNGILVNSPSAAHDLIELGLPAEYEVLKGTTYFDPVQPIDTSSDAFRSVFYERTRPTAVIEFYLAHPARFIEKLAVTSSRAYTLQPRPLGNFEKRSGQPDGGKARRWSVWSQTKQRLIPKSVWFTLGYLVVLLAVIFDLRRRGVQSLSIFLFALWLMMLITFATPILGDGMNDLEKHLFLYNAFFDLSLLIVTGFVVRAVLKHLDRRTAS